MAPLGHLEAAPKRVLVAGEVERHLLGRLEVELVRPEAPAIRVLQRVARLDAEERVVTRRVRGLEVVDVAGRDKGQPEALGETGQPVEGRLLGLEPDVLQLDVRRVPAEDLRQPVELRERVVLAMLRERPRDAAGEAPGQCDQPRRVPLEQLPVDARLVVVALEVAERAELHEVRIARVVGGQEREMRVPLGLDAAVVDDVHLAAEDRLDALRVRRLVEVDRARHRAVVGERDGGHLEARRLLRERRDPAGSVEDRVFRVDVQVDERSAHGMAIVVRRSAGQSRRICR